MNVDAKDFLPMVEETKRICFFDIEASGLKADYNSILCASIQPYKGKVTTYATERPGDDKMLVRQIRDELEKYLVIVGYYSKGFDLPMIRSRLLHFNMRDILPQYHVDMYYSLKGKTLVARRSMAHMSEWLDLEHKKMSVGPQVWNDVLARPKSTMNILIKRCEADVIEVMDLYDRTKHLIKEIKRG